MVDVDTNYTTQAGVTRVRVTVTNSRTTPQRIELTSTFAGPIWPPTGAILSTSEWRGATWSGIVEPSQTRGLGFSTPCEPTDSPVDVVAVERAEGNSTIDSKQTIRDLDSAAPPSRLINKR